MALQLSLAISHVTSNERIKGFRNCSALVSLYLFLIILFGFIFMKYEAVFFFLHYSLQAERRRRLGLPPEDPSTVKPAAPVVEEKKARACLYMLFT